MKKKNIYQQHGYANRAEYLHCIAQDYDTDLEIVQSLADALGEGEDFDGLVALLEHTNNDE